MLAERSLGTRRGERSLGTRRRERLCHAAVSGADAVTERPGLMACGTDIARPHKAVRERIIA
jgi:hypothetical protein